MVGGALWVVKGGGILLTGEQFPAVFEAATLGLPGLYARFGQRVGTLGKADALVACAALASAALAVAAPLAPLIAGAGFGPCLALALLGEVLGRNGIFPLVERSAVGDGAGRPLLIVALGIAWMLLGYSVVAIREAGSPTSAPARRASERRAPPPSPEHRA